MLAIARGLMARPRVLLLDEPSLGLAPIVVKEVRSLIGLVRERFGTAVLLVEQNASLALSVAERGYVMRTGQIIASGAIADLQDLELMREIYLGGPRRGTPGEDREQS
jgi:branched-chain amino acid transport system ATP-binding protein